MSASAVETLHVTYRSHYLDKGTPGTEVKSTRGLLELFGILIWPCQFEI